VAPLLAVAGVALEHEAVWSCVFMVTLRERPPCCLSADCAG
jgi:hypothetical protein